MRIPDSLLSFTRDDPGNVECVDKVCVDGVWALLHKAPTAWPKEVAQAYQQDLYFLFPESFKTENYNSKDIVCLCASVKNCPKKSRHAEENRECSEYRRGLCVEASVEANDCQPLALGSIARFHGLSKQRVHQIYTAARKKLILELAGDETIQEFLAEVFMGKREIPSPDQIAEFIEKAIQGGSMSE